MHIDSFIALAILVASFLAPALLSCKALIKFGFTLYFFVLEGLLTAFICGLSLQITLIHANHGHSASWMIIVALVCGGIAALSWFCGLLLFRRWLDKHPDWLRLHHD